MSHFEKPSDPAVAPLSKVPPTQQTLQNADDAEVKPALTIATSPEIEEWR